MAINRLVTVTPGALRDDWRQEPREPVAGNVKRTTDDSVDQAPFECSFTDQDLSDHQFQVLWSAYPEWDSLEVVDPT